MIYMEEKTSFLKSAQFLLWTVSKELECKQRRTKCFQISSQ